MIRASIIIVNYKTLDYLQACLTSLQPTITSADEVIVVDNDSGDQCGEVLPANFPWVKLVISQTNLGIGGGNNLGADHAQGSYLAFINPDTLVVEGWLEKLIDTLESDNDTGLVTSKILLTHAPEKINTCGNDIHISGLTLCRGMNQPASEFAKREAVSSVSGAAFVIRKTLFEQLGGFDESFFIYMEDTDLSLRARLAGYKCVYEPESLIKHDYVLTFGQNKTYYQERNRYLMLLKSYKVATLIVLLPVFLLAELITWGFILLKDRRNWINKFKACCWVIQNWNLIMRNRASTQRSRKLKDRDLLLNHTYKLDFDQTGSGFVSFIAHLVFDSLFFLFSMLSRVVIFW